MDTTRSARSLTVGLALLLAVGLLPTAAAASDVVDEPPTVDPVDGDVVPNRLVVTLRDDVRSVELPEVATERRSAALDRIGVQVIDIPEEHLPAARHQLERHPDVLDVEHDPVVAATGVTPNDPEWSQQWSPKLTDAPRAWSMTKGSSDVVIAVLDTGVDAGHPDLKGATVTGWNAIDDSNDTRDAHGHGTATAGVIAARTDNGVGVASYCWRCSIMPVKVLGDNGSGRGSDVTAGIIWATDKGADVINLSLGTSSRSSSMEKAVRYATDRGVAVVASAGNAGATGRFYPAGYDEVVAVAATDSSDRRYSWSNYGSWVDVAAPGCNRSTSLGSATTLFCGTSSAAPVVSGTLGLAASLRPDLPGTTFVDALRDGAINVGSFVRHGRVDAYRTLSRLDGQGGASTTGPRWRSGASLGTDPVSFASVDLAWPAATGDAPIASYRVRIDGRTVATTSSRSYRANSLTAGRSYEFTIQARDTEGNWSAPLRTTASPFVRFSDSRRSTFERDIGWLAAVGITKGCNPPTNDRFCPTDTVTRQQMAAFLTRALNLNKTSGIRFRDVPRGSTFATDIDKLATAGITKGCNPPTNDRFCPTDTVTREQMAAFVRRALG